MSNLKEIKNALKLLINSGTKRKNISLLHCNTEYPVKLEETNLKSINFLKENLILKLVSRTILLDLKHL